MTEESITLSPEEREFCAHTIREHCRIRNWNILALSCRTNHIHLVVQSPVEPGVVAKQLKAWCTRRLKERQRADGVKTVRENWWTEGESKHKLYTGHAVDGAIVYVTEGQ
jgi:REP element-mobilizing transposase RayT